MPRSDETIHSTYDGRCICLLTVNILFEALLRKLFKQGWIFSTRVCCFYGHNQIIIDFAVGADSIAEAQGI